MPHLVLTGNLDVSRAVTTCPREVHRWGRAVLKTEECWLRRDGAAMLVEGVVVELSRPQHPVAMVAGRGTDTIVRLWPLSTVERTTAVQRWLCLLAAGLQSTGAGRVRVTNIPREVWSDLGLLLDPELDIGRR
jgi:hypothetical protein